MKIPVKFYISYSLLKFLALFFMTYDHVFRFIFKINDTDLILLPGRFAFPIFTFLIAYNLAKKENFLKYIKRLSLFALITVPIDLYFFPKPYLNILFTFMLAIALIWCLKKAVTVKNKPARGIIFAYIILLGICLGFFVEYAIEGIILFAALYYFFKSRKVVFFLLALCMLAVMMPSLLYACLIIPFGILLLLVEPVPSPNPSSFSKTGWMFYAYYPFHKLIIGLIAKMM